MSSSDKNVPNKYEEKIFAWRDNSARTGHPKFSELFFEAKKNHWPEPAAGVPERPHTLPIKVSQQYQQQIIWKQSSRHFQGDHIRWTAVLEMTLFDWSRRHCHWSMLYDSRRVCGEFGADCSRTAAICAVSASSPVGSWELFLWYAVSYCPLSK